MRTVEPVRGVSKCASQVQSTSSSGCASHRDLNGSIPLFWIAFIKPSDARAPILVEIQYVSVAAH
jgi:hypothetical protein